MAKYIDADELIKKLKTDTNMMLDDIATVEDAIADMQPADVEPVRLWTPCSSELPKTGKAVLCYTRFLRPYTVGTLEQLPTDKEPTFRPGNLIPDRHVKWWMPLPEPPMVRRR